jgi:hypothetical protein
MRRPASLLLAIALMATVRVAMPLPAVACSCVMPDPAPMLAASRDATLSVFTGVAGALEAMGQPIALTRWYRGAPPPTGVAVLDPRGFVDPMGGTCGTHAPGAGTEWIFVAPRDETGRYLVSMCTLHAPLDSDGGRSLLAEAEAVFGDPLVPKAEGPADGADPGSALDAVLPILIGMLAAVGAVLGAFGVLGRRR